MDLRSVVEQAAGRVAPGGRLVSMRPLTGGVSADVFELVIATAGGDERTVVFRQHRGADFKQHGGTVAADEHRVLAALHRHGMAVPEPYLFDDGTADVAPFLVLEWVDGTTAVADADLASALEQMARFLVDLHAIDAVAAGLGDVAAIEDPVAGVVASLPSDEVGDRLRSRLEHATTAPVANGRSLLHGDYWPGNVIWQGGRLAAVIDWEDARLGDPLADLATARVELLCQYGADAVARFTDHYVEATRAAGRPVRLDALVVWELYVSAAALATMADWGLEPAAEAERRRRTREVFDRAASSLR